MGKQLVVRVHYDEEAAVWVATSDEVPGLTTAATTYQTMRARVLAAAPQLLRDNGFVPRIPDARTVPLYFEHGGA